MKNAALCNCIALYDYSPDHCDLKGWFEYMEKWAEDIGTPWESLGSNLSRKLMLYKNGKKKIEKSDYNKDLNIELYGGVSEPGTHLNWKTCSSFFMEEDGLRHSLKLCFPENSKIFNKENLATVLNSLLSFGDFKYGICYQRPYNMGPSLYIGGSLGGINLSLQERDQIGKWKNEYCFDDGNYRTGLLRDVYPFNIFVQTHLNEKVGKQTLEQWINNDPRHGVLEKITDNHWLWSIAPENIPAAQETLQEAGLLLCYKP